MFGLFDRLYYDPNVHSTLEWSEHEGKMVLRVNGKIVQIPEAKMMIDLNERTEGMNKLPPEWVQRELDFNGSAETGGIRYDEGKPRPDLIPPEFIKALGELYSEGAKKYEARNWEKGMDWSRMLAAHKRHMNKWELGEMIDNETGCHHLIHAIWNLIALYVYRERNIGNNDIPRIEGNST